MKPVSHNKPPCCTFEKKADGTWDVNRGGTLEALGTPFAVTAGGADISVPENDQVYKVVYVEADETMTITEF